MFRVLILLLALTARISAEDVVEEDNVWILNSTNFNSFVKENEFVLVEFYAPWCDHCKKLAPEYTKAASLLKEEGSAVKLAKVDATVELQLAATYEVKEYPTLKFFKNGTLVFYTGSQTHEGIVTWLKRRTGPSVKDLTDSASVSAFKDEATIVVVGFFKDQNSDGAQEYLKAASDFDDVLFGITSNTTVFDEYKVQKDGVILFKKFDEGRNDFDGELNETVIKSFVRLHQLPLVVEFSQETVIKIFNSDVRKHVLLFLRKTGNEEQLIQEFREVAREFFGEFIFIVLDAADNNHARILEFFVFKNDSDPSLRIMNFEDTTRYLPASEGVNPAAIRQFINDFRDEKIKPYFESQDIPEDWDKKPVKVLVAKNFEDVVFDKEKSVFVQFYTPFCDLCRDMDPVWEELAESYKDNDKIVIAKIDASANEFRNIFPQRYPTLKFFLRESNEVIDYTAENTVKGFQTFLDSDGKEGATIVEEEIPEEAAEKEQEKQADKIKEEL